MLFSRTPLSSHGTLLPQKQATASKTMQPPRSLITDFARILSIHSTFLLICSAFQMRNKFPYPPGEYGWSTDLATIQRSVDWQLANLKTDYIDFGFIHCLDEASDLAAYEKSGALGYVLDLKEQGVIRHIGLSSHAPELVHKVLDLGILDMLMFSINPMYDYGQGDYANGSSEERYDLYRRCEKEGVGISVMKPFNAGQLLDAAKSPFHQALTTAQCIPVCTG